MARRTAINAVKAGACCALLLVAPALMAQSRLSQSLGEAGNPVAPDAAAAPADASEAPRVVRKVVQPTIPRNLPDVVTPQIAAPADAPAAAPTDSPSANGAPEVVQPQVPLVIVPPAPPPAPASAALPGAARAASAGAQGQVVPPVQANEAQPAPEPPAASGPPADPRRDTGPIARPPVHAGDQWAYRRSSGKVSQVMRQTALKVSDDGIALRTQMIDSPDTSTVLYDRQWGLVASGFNDYLPPLNYYAFPLYLDKRWTINASVHNFGAAQTGRVKGEAHAVAWEQVEVPAGKFLALRIEIDIETADPGDPTRTVRVRETHWYARTVMRPVKVESHSVVADGTPSTETTELLSFRME